MSQIRDLQQDFAAAPAALFTEAVSIMARLRAPGGCPWDREQSFDSIKPHTLEETYEVFDAIERRHWQDLCEELGDLLLQVLFYAQMAAEAGHFTIADVIAGLNQKLIRRHPHVFGEGIAKGGASGPAAGSAIDSAQVLRNWDAIKRAEKADRAESAAGASALDAIPRSLPALLEARKLGSRASKSGFDWPDTRGLFEKLEEEAGELRQAIGDSSAARPNEMPAGQSSRTAASETIISEVGDLLFTMVNLARHLRVDPEFAVRKTNTKFRRRFAAMEAAAPRRLEDLPPHELELLWTRAKEAENRAAR